MLDVPSEFNKTLKDGFWPMISVAPSFEDEFTERGNLRKEYNEDEYFLGQTQDCPAKSFWINWNLYKGYFVAIWPSKDDTKHLVWIARVLSNPNSNPEHPNCVLIQYFLPMSCNRNLQNSLQAEILVMVCSRRFIKQMEKCGEAQIPY